MRLDPHAKLLWQGSRVQSWLEMGTTLPILVEISPTGYCNAACPWCHFGDKHDPQKIDKEIMFAALSDMAVFGVKAINWTGGGEPIIHPDFKEFTNFAHRKGLKQGLFTNAYKEIPNQELFEWIRVTLTDRGYEVIKRPRVPFGICVNQIESQSEAELRGLCIGAKNLGAVYFQIRPALVGSYEIQPVLEAPEYLKEYETSEFKVYTTPYKYIESIRKRNYDKCYGYFFCPSIDWRGNLGICLYMMHRQEFVMGNLKREKFPEIWGRIPKYIGVVPECQNCCKNHEINRILFAAKNVEQTDFL